MKKTGVNIEPQKLRRRWHGSSHVSSIKSVVYGIYLLTAFFVEIGQTMSHVRHLGLFCFEGCRLLQMREKQTPAQTLPCR